MEIVKFRGKRIDNGEWVSGFHFISPLTDENSGTTPDKGWFFLTGEKRHCISTDSGVVFVVDGNTIGQFIGIQDKKGIDLYTSDILRTPRGDWGVIVWKAPHFEVTVSAEQSCLYTTQYYNDAEIIGNVHDNPELLKD